MNTLPSGWTIARLCDVADWGSGGTPSRKNEAYFGGDIPWVKTGELGQGVIVDTEEKLTESGIKNSSAKVFPKGSVAVAMYGATIGKAAILGIDAATNQACAVGIPRESVTLTKFVFYYLLSQKQALIEAGKGGAQPNISQSIIKEWPIPLPPLAEQQRIADKLDALLARVDACRARLGRVPALLKRFRQAVLAAAVAGRLCADDQEAEVEDTPILPLSHVISFLKTGPFGSTLHKSDYVLNGIPVVNPMHINEGRILPSDEMTVSEMKANELTEFKLKKGDVVLGRRGVMGRCAVVGEVEEGWLCGSGSMFMRPSDKVLPEYLQMFLSSPMTVAALDDGAVGSTMSNLNQGILLGLTIRTPPLAEQHEIVRRVETLFAYADQLDARLAAARTRVEQLTPSLLAKAFRGELVNGE